MSYERVGVIPQARNAPNLSSRRPAGPVGDLLGPVSRQTSQVDPDLARLARSCGMTGGEWSDPWCDGARLHDPRSTSSLETLWSDALRADRCPLPLPTSLGSQCDHRVNTRGAPCRDDHRYQCDNKQDETNEAKHRRLSGRRLE